MHAIYFVMEHWFWNSARVMVLFFLKCSVKTPIISISDIESECFPLDFTLWHRFLRTLSVSFLSGLMFTDFRTMSGPFSLPLLSSSLDLRLMSNWHSPSKCTIFPCWSWKAISSWKATITACISAGVSVHCLLQYCRYLPSACCRFSRGILISETRNSCPDFHRSHIQLYPFFKNCFYMVWNA